MNKQDRKRLTALKLKIEDLVSQAEALSAEARDLADAEQEKFDNLSEGLQQSERGQQMETDAGTLGEIADALDSGNAGEANDTFNNIEF